MYIGDDEQHSHTPIPCNYSKALSLCYTEDELGRAKSKDVARRVGINLPCWSEPVRGCFLITMKRRDFAQTLDRGRPLTGTQLGTEHNSDILRWIRSFDILFVG